MERGKVVPLPQQAAQASDRAERETWRARAAALLALRQSEGWDTYRTLLGDLENQAIQSLVTDGKDRHDHWAGFLAGLRTAANLPDTVIAKTKDLTGPGPA